MKADRAELCFLTIAEAAPLIAAGTLSPLALVEAMLARIAALDPELQSYLLVLAEPARAAARQAGEEIAAGRWRGPLHGIPYAAKDNYFTAGVPTTAGSRVMAEHVPETTASVIERLEEAGAILLGKLNTWEYGTGNGGVYFDLPAPPARNPWNLDHFTGGSSTGAGAAVAAGLALFALGSDTGGSVRFPAAACGLDGLKPTYGLVSRAGILPNCWSLDVAGPLCRSAEDTALVLRAIAGPDSRDQGSAQGSAARPAEDYLVRLHTGVRGLSVGVVREFGPDAPSIDPPMLHALDAAAETLARLGARIVERHLPAPLALYRQVASVINWSESYSIHEDDFLTRGHLMGRALREKMIAGFHVRAADYLAAQRQRRVLAAATDALVRSSDVLLLPGPFHVAPPLAEQDAVMAYTHEAAMAPFSISGHPALSICTGYDPKGLPLSAQLVGRYFDEAAVLRVAAAYEAATPWRERHPALREMAAHV